MKLACPICKAPATHEVQWSDDSIRVYCEKDARAVTANAKTEVRSVRRLGG